MQNEKIKITILGCGTSTGVPLIHCRCKVCRSSDPKNHRTRASIWIQANGKSLLVDVSPDFRQQVMKAKIPKIDAILFTHPHADHISGIDEIRSYNFIQQQRIPAYGHDWTIDQLPKRFPYIFTPTKIEGGGVAQIDLNKISLNEKFSVQGVVVQSISLDHGSEKVAGYRIGNFAYLTDFHRISEDSMNRLKGLDVVIMDCLRLQAHSTHVNFDQALNYALQLKAKRTIFTHMGHDFDFRSFSKKLPKKHQLAFDGMKVQST